MKNKMEWIWKKAVIASSEVPPWHLVTNTEENHEEIIRRSCNLDLRLAKYEVGLFLICFRRNCCFHPHGTRTVYQTTQCHIPDYHSLNPFHATYICMCPLTLPYSFIRKRLWRVNTVKSVRSRKNCRSTTCCSTLEHEEYFKLLCVCYRHRQKTAEEK
jgi:hypothetical protein